MIYILLLILSTFVNSLANASDQTLENYIANFDYAARKKMKIDSLKLIELLKMSKAKLIDIRFNEEYSAWKVGYSKSIPLKVSIN